MRINEYMREQITAQACEEFFPNEMEMNMRKQLTSIWENHIRKTYGPPPDFYNDTYVIPTNHGDVSFEGTWMQGLFTQRTSKKDNTQIIREICPVSGLCELADILADFNYSKEKFKEALSGELMKFSTIESFTKAFPQLKGIIDMTFGVKEENLPEEVFIDMKEINDFLKG